jgi:hypothetical protein
MVPMFKLSDIIILIGTMAFLVLYAAAIIVQIKGHRFSLYHVAVALIVGFVGSIATFFSLYWMFDRG